MKKSLFGLMAIAILTSQSHADLILDYVSANAAAIAATNVDSRVSGDSITAAGGLDQGTGGTFNWRDWGNSGTAFTSFNEAIANDKFWTWGFDVTDSLTLIDLTDMSIDLDRSPTGPNQFQIDASINGGSATTLDTFDFGDGALVTTRNINLTSLSQLKNGDSIVFRLGAFGADSGGFSSSGTFDFENTLVINGTFSTVPEPSSIAVMSVMGLLTGGLLFRRRRSLGKAKA